MELTFLGTSGAIPTKERNQSAIHLKFLSHNILFDCGEGTQRQLFKANISPMKINSIFITHIHGDHLLGLGGLIQTMNFNNRTKDLHIYGPLETKKYIDFFSSWDCIDFNFKIKFHQLKEGNVVNEPEFKINAFELEHGLPCYGFTFEEKVEINVDNKKFKKLGLTEGPLIKELKEKGKIKINGKTIKIEDISKPMRKPKKISIVLDTRPIQSIAKHVQNSDILVCEATHLDKLKEKSHEYGHMTAKDASMIAKKAGVGKLILTHFSSRYKEEKELEKESKKIFKNTIAAKDFSVFEL